MFYLEQLLGEGRGGEGRVRKGTRQDERRNRAYWVF